MSSSSSIKRGALLSYSASILNILIGLLYTPWLIRSLGSSDYGLYALATSFVSYFLIDFGLGNSIAKYLSGYRAKNQDLEIENFMGVVYKTYLIICLVIAVIFVAVYFNIESIFKGLTPIEVERFRFIFIVIAIYSVCSFPFNTFIGVLTAYEKFVPLQKSNILQKLTLVISMSVALLLGYGVFALVLIQVFAGVVTIIYRYYYVRQCNIKVNWLYSDRTAIIDILKFSVWVCLLGICFQLIYSFQNTVLGMVSDTQNISIYNVSHTVYGFVFAFAYALNGMFLPKVSFIEAGSEDSSEMINSLMVKVGRCQILLIGLMVSGFFLFGKVFLRLWIGDEYSDAYYVGLMLIIPTIFVLTEEIPNTLLYVRNKVKYRAIAYSIGTLICSVMTYFLSSKLGAIGAGISVFIAVVVFDVICMNIFYHKKMSVDVLGFLKNCHLKYIIPCLLVVFIGLGFNYFLLKDSWLYLGIAICVYVTAYIIVMWFLFMNDFEKSLVKNAISKVRGK